MTQSKDNDTDVDIVTLTGSDSITLSDLMVETIDLDNLVYKDSMYTSSADNTFVVDINDGTFTLNDTISLDSTIDGLTNITFNKVEFEDHMPSPEKLKKMCMHYPALEKAYENFKTIYKMVDQDFKGNHEDDEDVPF